jgi:hypothetical protein
MKTLEYRIGKLFGTNLCFNLSLNRWLVGFGWIKYSSQLTVHLNLGPLVIILSIVKE